MKRKFSGSLMRYEREKECGYTLQKLADLMGVNWQSVLRWESNKVKPNADYVALIADCLGCDINDLYEIIEQ